MITLETDANLRHWLAHLELAHLTESFIATGWRALGQQPLRGCPEIT